MARTKSSKKTDIYTKISESLRRKTFGDPSAELDPCSLSGLIDRTLYACAYPQACLMKYLTLIENDSKHARVCLDRVDAAIVQLKKLRKTKKHTLKRST